MKDRTPTTNPKGNLATEDEVGAFLAKVKANPLPVRANSRGRLMFAMDATASREPTWDKACHIQSEMFQETARLGGLDVQLVFWRGFGEMKSSKWVADASSLARLMSSVRCLAGRTQVEKLLKHAVRETGRTKVNAVVLIGDAFEEDIDQALHPAGELGMLGVPVFCFHEGGDTVAANVFRQIASLTKGAFCRFDSASASQLRDLLAAVAVYAAGGQAALADYGRNKGGEILRLSHDLGGGKR